MKKCKSGRDGRMGWRGGKKQSFISNTNQAKKSKRNRGKEKTSGPITEFKTCKELSTIKKWVAD